MEEVITLKDTVASLREPGGCPWDQEQTHQSLAICLVEECSELLEAIDNKSLGQVSVAGREYLRDMANARQDVNDRTCWVEVCYCPTPLQEEKPYWEEYFESLEIKNAHDRKQCRDLNGTESWACDTCDCTERLEAKMATWGTDFIPTLKMMLKDEKNS